MKFYLNKKKKRKIVGGRIAFLRRTEAIFLLIGDAFNGFE